jgi:transcriptional regulator with XRE-family HTH domain
MAFKANCPEIRRVRTAKGWSQEDLADHAGLGLRTVQRAETVGACRPGTLAALAKALGVTTAELSSSSEMSVPIKTDVRELQRLGAEMEALRRKTEPRKVPGRILAALTIHINPPAGERLATGNERLDPLEDAILQLQRVLVHFLIDTFDNETAEFGLGLRRRLLDADVHIMGAIGRFQWIPPGVTVLVQDAEFWQESSAILRRGFAYVPTATVYGPGEVSSLGLKNKSKERVLILVGRR